MSIDPASENYATADWLRAAAVRDVDIKAPGPNGETSGKALVIASASSPSGDMTVHGPDATGADPTANPVYVAGIDQNGKVAPLQTVGGYIQTIGEQMQGQPMGMFGTPMLGMDPGASALPLLVDENGNLYTIPLAASFWPETTTPLAAAATFTGAARDAGAASPGPVAPAYFNGFFLSDQTGTASLQCSDDGVTWATCATEILAAATPLILQTPAFARNHRVVLANGGTPQGSVTVRSSYTAA
jgi:hypothetical protein